MAPLPKSANAVKCALWKTNLSPVELTARRARDAKAAKKRRASEKTANATSHEGLALAKEKNKHQLAMAKEKNKHALQLAATKAQAKEKKLLIEAQAKECTAMNKTHVGLAEVQSKSSKHFYNLQFKAGAGVRELVNKPSPSHPIEDGEVGQLEVADHREESLVDTDDRKDTIDEPREESLVDTDDRKDTVDEPREESLVDTDDRKDTVDERQGREESLVDDRDAEYQSPRLLQVAPRTYYNGNQWLLDRLKYATEHPTPPKPKFAGPLTLDRLPMSAGAFNMEEDEVVANRANKLLHEVLEKAHPKLQEVDGPGQVLKQMNKNQSDWDSKVWDAMNYIMKERNEMVHTKWGWKLRWGLKNYLDAMHFVFANIAPNFTLTHYNHEAERLMDGNVFLKDENARLKEQLAQFQPSKKRGRNDPYSGDDYEEGSGGYPNEKRVRRDYDEYGNY
jgi:hypothetical protein